MFLLSFSLCLIADKAWSYLPKEGNVTATLGPLMSQSDFKPPGSVPRPSSNGIGLIANGDLGDTGSLEIAMFQFRKAFLRESAANSILEETSLLHITLGYRFWISPRVATSLSFYSSYAMGEPNILYNDFPAGTPIDTSARDITEYGLDWALQLELWNQGRYAVVADARYSYSVTSKKEEMSNHYGLMIGLRYFIQEQQIREKKKTDL